MNLFCPECAGTSMIERPNMHGIPTAMPCPACSPDVGKDPGVNKLPGTKRGHPQTSVEAAYSAFPATGTVRLAVLKAYRDVYPTGMTHEEMEDLFFKGTSSSTYRSRATELVRGGWLIDSGHRRKTRAGNDAIVWILSEKAAKRFGVLYKLAKGKPYVE